MAMDALTLLESGTHALLVAIASIAGIILSTSIAFIIYNLFFHPLRHYPGPKLWAASVIPFACSQLRGTDVYLILAHHKRYGPVVRISPNSLSYANSAVYRDALAHRKAGHDEFGKSKVFEVTPVNGVVSMLFANRDDHARQRRAFAASFSEKSMQRQEALVRSHVDSLICGLKERCADGAMDMTAWLNWTSFDSMPPKLPHYSQD